MVAFQPTFDFIAAGVQGDNLLFFASARDLPRARCAPAAAG